MIFHAKQRRICIGVFIETNEIGQNLDASALVGLCSLLAGFFALMSFGSFPKWIDRALMVMLFDFCVCTLLALVWALFMPQWLESAMEGASRLALTTVAIIVGAFLLMIVYEFVRRGP